MTHLPQSFLLLPPPNGRAFAIIQKKSALQTIKKAMTLRALSRDELLFFKQFKTGLSQRLKATPNEVIRAIQCPEVSAPINAPASQLRRNTALVQLIHELSMPGEWRIQFDAIRIEAKKEIILFEPLAEGYRQAGKSIDVLITGQWNALTSLKEKGLVKTIQINTLLGGQDFALWDANPLFQVEAHPEKEGNAINLSGKKTSTWIKALNDAMSLIQEYLPEWWGEFPNSLKRIVPVGYHPEIHESASYSEALGIAYTSLHPNVVTMAEAIIHETQHNKLNTLLQLEPVLFNGNSCWTTSPVRPDLRPLNGVLLAAHAFIPVAAMHLRLWKEKAEVANNPDFHKRRLSVIRSNQKAMETLMEKSEPSQKGAAILNGMLTLHNAIVSTSEEGKTNK